MSDGNESDVRPSRIVAKLGRLDGSDIGKGRKKSVGEDSSSSRETSPDRTRRRSFSQNSDDDDIVIPQNEDEDTPEPDAPVIRRAMAFPWQESGATATPHLVTYEAPIPPRVAASSTNFLPGQAVTPPAPPTTQSPQRGGRGGAGTKRRARGKTRHYNDEFSDKTGSFRLKGYGNDSKTSRLGDRPYAQMYRVQATVEPSGKSTIGMLAPASNQVASVFASVDMAGTTSGGMHTGSFRAIAPGPAPSPPASTSSVPTTTDGNTSAPSPVVGTTNQTISTTPGSRTKSPIAIPKRTARKSISSVESTSEQSRVSPRSTSRSPENRVASSSSTATLGLHYRRDYARGTEIASSQASTRTHTRTSHSHSQSGAESSGTRNQRSGVSAQRAIHNFRSDTANPSSELTQVNRVMRMVTLLIEDVRSGVTDHQLAEVYVPLRTAEDPNDGFWANAHDISQALQSSPSRIDGPAKVYAMRRNFRQFFLRVSADNVDTMSSANLIVSNLRTLVIVVEPPPPQDGSLPLPPVKPQGRPRMPSTDREASRSPAATSPAQRTHDTDGSSSQRKRPRSSSYSSSYDSGSDVSLDPSRRPHGHHRTSHRRTTSSVSYSSSEKPHRPSGPVEPLRNVISRRIDSFPASLRTADGQLPSWAQIPLSREPTPQPDVNKEQLDEAIARAIQPDIGKDEYWVEFMRLKAIPPPLTVPDTLKQYRFAQKKVNEWQGRLAPFESAKYIVEKKHVMKALFLDERWGSECTETLDLIELYGPDGEHYEDPKVGVMLEDMGPPKGRPAKKLLRMLRATHEDWMREHRAANVVTGSGSGSSKGKEREMVVR